VNVEVVPQLGKFMMAGDRRLKATQALLTRAVVPTLRIADMSMRQAPISRKQMLDDALDTTMMLAAASASITGLRREAIRFKLGTKGKHIWGGDVPNSSPWLLGDDLASKIKANNQSASLFRGGNFRARMHPYARGFGFAAQYARRGRGSLKLIKGSKN
jgi:hypothetical protein